MIPESFVEALRCPEDVAVLVDFDGTLAPIVADPMAARPNPGSVELLNRLSTSVGTVGVISGRPIEFLTELLPDSLSVSGLYGLETLVDGERRTNEQGGCWREVIADLSTHAEAAGPAGMRVESKDLSITLHYREHPEAADAVAAWAAGESARSGMLARPARMSWELHPPIPLDKGTALLELAGDKAAVCFVGDDHGDLPAFTALDGLADAGRTTLRVAVDSAEVDSDLRDAADLVVDGPSGVELLLADFLDCLTVSTA
jgi:trehalose 6-phosphate phosphatase